MYQVRASTSHSPRPAGQCVVWTHPYQPVALWQACAASVECNIYIHIYICNIYIYICNIYIYIYIYIYITQTSRSSLCRIRNRQLHPHPCPCPHRPVRAILPLGRKEVADGGVGMRGEGLI
jgi:hypothetical protein